MDINDNKIIEWLWKGLVFLLGGYSIVVRYLWKQEKARQKRQDDRITSLEEKMNHAITKPQVEDIVEKVEKDFRREHQTIIQVIGNTKRELREDIHELRDIIVNHMPNRNK